MSETIAPLWLLDKNIVRNALRAMVELELGQPPTAADLPPLEILRLARESRVRGVISPELENILRRRVNLPAVRVALAVLSVFRPTRYFKRWASRLRGEGFTREDAKVLALGTFGTDDVQSRFGADAVVTGDLHLIHNYTQRHSLIQQRLKAMAAQLKKPYCEAELPAVITPVEAVESLSVEASELHS